MTNFLVALLLAIILHPFHLGAPVMATDPEAGVARELARERAALISDLRYRLSLELAPGAARLKGREEIRLRLARVAGEVTLDFRDLDADGQLIEGAVREVTVNGAAVPDLRQVNGHLLLPGKYFSPGENTVALTFESGIAPAGRSVTRHLDRDDGGEYLYTLFVPMDASLAFPCFDQPDLKARFTLEVTAPVDWTVVSNAEIESQSTDVAGARRQTQFAETRPMSTYLFAFAAGPFEIIDAPGGAVPMRMYARRSQLARAREEAPEILRQTRAGMGHMADFFAQPFPFPKYDLVLLPGFAYGGMEHAGAIFFREEALLFRTAPTADDRAGRATLLLHELAHQWFGDLVTMRWFDDLWLKEGFADYMAYHALAAQRPPAEVWKRFYQTHKPAAYAIDATRGATPIYQEVRNLRDAKSAYGAIVYAKAPALLRALSFLIGEPAFRGGVRLFLKEHAYANAEWADLVQACERASGEPLRDWAAAWIGRRGMPQVEVEWACDGAGRISRLALRQRDALGEGGLWPIKTQLLLVGPGAAERITARLEAGAAEVREAAGRRCPAFVFANDGDYGYGRFLLDARSRSAVAERVAREPDAFLRTMLWGALWDSVREAQLDPREFLRLLVAALPGEADEELTASLLARAQTAYQRYLKPAARDEVGPGIEKLCAERMLKAGSLGLRITYFRAFRALARTEAARARLKEVLASRLQVPGMELRPLDRWRIVTALLAERDAEAEALLGAERARDASDEGRKYAYVAEAARGAAATKRRYFDDYLGNRAVPEDWIQESLASFNWWSQEELTRPYLGPALAALPQVKQGRKIFFVLAWLNAFIGGQQGDEALARVREFLHGEGLDQDLRLKVLEVGDELERAVRIRAR